MHINYTLIKKKQNYEEKVKMQATDWDKVFKIGISDKGLSPEYIKDSYKLIIKGQANQQRSVYSKLWFFQQSCMDMRVGL